MTLLYLELGALVVGVHNLMIYLGMASVVAVACVWVALAGIHSHGLSCVNRLGETVMVLV